VLDLRWLRDHPEAFDAAMQRRGSDARASRLLELDEALRAAQAQLQEQQARRNAASKEIGGLRSRGEDATALMAEVAALKGEIAANEELVRTRSGALEDELATLPNVLADDVPDGPDESANVEIRQWGEPPDLSAPVRQHDEIGPALGMDFQAAARMSGARFVALRGQLARLERALATFMLDIQTGEHGYTEVAPPLLVRDTAVYGTGQLPKFADDLFRTTTGYWLIPTAEVSLTNLVADQILSESDLPLRFTAWTPCFRSEAGAAGKDTRGMIRQHQFSKVEMVSVTRPEDSADEHERMAGCAEAILKRLELPYRVVVLASGDTGFGARKTYDLEVWLPGQDTYREVSSCSNCGDFQARRMRARFRRQGERQTEFVHTLNGSGLAVGRTLIALIENGQQPDGSVALPDAIRPFMGGLGRLVPDG
jgi:seryl-tRNA synthetase